MLTEFTIKNFRVFNEDGVSIQLSPITILTGRNSAGKSSVVKAVTLLNSFLQQIKYDKDKGHEIVLANYKIDFTKYPNTLLGGMDKVLHRNSKNSNVTFEYTIHSCMLFSDVIVSLSFGMDTNDEIKNGYLQSLEIRTMDDKIIYRSSKKDGSHYDMNLIKDTFSNFIELEFITHNFCGLEVEYDLQANISKTVYEEQRTKHIDAMRKFDKSMRDDVFKYVRNKYSAKEPIASKLDGEVIDWTEKNGSFFYIPVIDDYLSNLSKDKIKDAVTELTKDIDGEGELFAISRITDNFLQSSFSTIREYFNSLESTFLDDVSDMSIINISSPSLPRHFQWQPLNITMNPLNMETGWSYPPVNKAKEFEDWKEQPIDFMYVYEAIMLLNAQYAKSSNSNFYNIDKFFGFFSHNIFGVFQRYASNIVEEVMLPEWCDTISYVSTSRMEMQRLYMLGSHSDFSIMLNNYMEAKRNYLNKANNSDYEPDSFMNKWIKRLGIGHSISIEREKEGVGMYVRLHKNEGDKGVVLADEGYGVTQLAAILIPIETVILSNKGKQANLYYGMSALDGYDATKFHYAQRTVAVEEPEIHLHPQYQSLLADLFAEAAEKYNIHFIVETHSEYLIRKIQFLVAKKSLQSDIISLNYVHSQDDYISPSENLVKRIDINTDGSLSDSFGTGFYDESDNLSMDLLKTQIGNYE